AVAVAVGAGNVGRAPSMVAALGVIAGFATFVDWRLWARWPARRHGTVLVAVPIFVLGQVSYAFVTSLPLAVGLFAATLAVVTASHVWPHWCEVPESHVRSALLGTARSSADWSRRPFRAAAGASVTVVRNGRRAVASGAATLWRRGPATRIGNRPAVLLVAASVGVVALFAPLIWRLVNSDPPARVVGINDYPLHLDAVWTLRFWPLHVDAPHFLFHVLSAGIAPALGRQLAPVVVLLVAVLCTYWAAYAVVRGPLRDDPALTPVAGVWTALAFLFWETPTLLLIWLHLVPDSSRFMTVHAMYSPTWVVALPFALATVAMLDRVFARWAGPDGPSVQRHAALGGVMVVGALAKPSFALVLVPGLLAYLLLFERRSGGEQRQSLRAAASLWAWVAVPAALVMGWQVWFMAGSTSPVGGDTFRFAPISGPIFGWSQARWPFWLPLGWFAIVVWATRGQFLRERAVRLVGCCVVPAVAVFLLFTEVGPRAQHGNLGVPLQVCATLLFALSLRSAASALGSWHRDLPRRIPVWFPVIVFCGALFIGSGVVAWADSLGILHVPINWKPYF
ncbi:MAG: hypothetical protein ACKOYM_01135, partial [Actinomycetes bacterium]